RRECRDKGDEREADHQGGRSRGGPLWVPLRVVARERAGGTTEARRREPNRLRERDNDPRREQRNADEDEQRADAHVQEHLRRSEAAPEQAVDERGEAEKRRGGRAGAPEPVKPSRRKLRALADRRDRRHPRRAERGTEARAER